MTNPDFNPIAKSVDKLTDYATSLTGTDIRIVINVYGDEPLFLLGEPKIFTSIDFICVGKDNTEPETHYGASIYFAVKFTKEEMAREMAFAKANIDNYAYPKLKKVENDKTEEYSEG